MDCCTPDKTVTWGHFHIGMLSTASLLKEELKKLKTKKKQTEENLKAFSFLPLDFVVIPAQVHKFCVLSLPVSFC